MRGIRPVDLSSVTSAQARELLADSRKIIEKLIYKQVRRSYGYELDDLRSVAEVAVLEAYVTYSPAAYGASSRSTWTGRLRSPGNSDRCESSTICERTS